MSPPALDSWPSSQDLSDFNQWMACLGSRFAGTQEHKDLLDQIDKSLETLVMSGVLTREAVPVEFTNWEPGAMSLTLSPSTSIPVAGYMPFSGSTTSEPNKEITAKLFYQEPSYFKRKWSLLNLFSPLKVKNKHADKIVAFWVPSAEIPKWLLKYTAWNRHSDFSEWAPYRRPITLENQAPCLNHAREKGIKGVVLILDMSPPHAEDQYLPFTRHAEPAVGGIPGIHVDREQRQKLKQHAENNCDATLKLESQFISNTTSDHLVFTLPGAISVDQEEIVLVQTHTDGPGAVEENGVMALLALIHRFAEMPKEERRRTLVFLFATGHFVQQLEGAKSLLWENPPDWFKKKIKAAVAIEHLGSVEWEDVAGGYRARTDQCAKELPEPPLLFVPKKRHPLAEMAANHLPAARTIVIPARGRTKTFFGRKVFGEGQYVACAGVPTVGWVPNPDYMFSSASPGGPTMPGHFEKLDPARMLRELEAFRGLVWKLVTDPLPSWPAVTPDAERCREAKNKCP